MGKEIRLAIGPQEANVSMEIQLTVWKNSNIAVLSTENNLQATQGHLKLIACLHTASAIAAPPGDEAERLRGIRAPLHGQDRPSTWGLCAGHNGWR